MPRLSSIRYVDGLALHLRFEDGAEGDVDFASFMKFPGMLAQLRDPEYFARAFIHPESRAVTWPNGMDVDTLVLYSKVTGRSIRSLLLPKAQRVRPRSTRRRSRAAT